PHQPAHQPQPRRTSRAEQQEINLHQSKPKSKSHPNQQDKTIENTSIHRSVANTIKTRKKRHATTHQQKHNKNNPKKQEKHPQKPKHGSVAQST
ncbi:hypothetical protein QP840_02595, partial [Bifidobacterium sp. UMB6791A]|nr:hypothetical protein [Bifidobacterium sp. UMB6791A]